MQGSLWQTPVSRSGHTPTLVHGMWFFRKQPRICRAFVVIFKPRWEKKRKCFQFARNSFCIRVRTRVSNRLQISRLIWRIYCRYYSCHYPYWGGQLVYLIASLRVPRFQRARHFEHSHAEIFQFLSFFSASHLKYARVKITSFLLYSVYKTVRSKWFVFASNGSRPSYYDTRLHVLHRLPSTCIYYPFPRRRRTMRSRR